MSFGMNSQTAQGELTQEVPTTASQLSMSQYAQSQGQGFANDAQNTQQFQVQSQNLDLNQTNGPKQADEQNGDAPVLVIPLDEKEEENTTKAVENARRFLIPKCRGFHKCNLLSFIIYVLVYMVILFLAFINEDSKVQNNLERAKFFAYPFDKQRRACGDAMQLDALAVDYSRYVDSPTNLKAFCEFYQLMARQKIIASTEVENADCNTIGSDPRTDEADKQSQAFFTAMRGLYSNMTNYEIGYQAANQMVCVNKAEIYLDNPGDTETTPKNATIQPNVTTRVCKPHGDVVMDTNGSIKSVARNMEYVCNREIKDIIHLINSNARQFNLNGTTPLPSDTQFLTATQYQTIKTAIQYYDKELILLLSNCVEMPAEKVIDFYFVYEPWMLETGRQKCIIQYNSALQQKSGVMDTAVIYLQYIMTAFTQIIPNAIQEFEQRYQFVIISFGVTVVLTIFVQVVMYVFVQVIVLASMAVVIIALIVFIVSIGNTCAKSIALNAQYQADNGFYNSTYQLQVIAFVALLILAIIILLVLVGLSILIAAMAKSIQNTIKIVSSTIQKIKLGVLIPIILLVFCIGHIVFSVCIIFTHMAGQTFDANLVSFQFVTKEAGQSSETDRTAILLMLLYIVFAIHGIFLCINIMEYILGGSVIKYYFNHNIKNFRKLIQKNIENDNLGVADPNQMNQNVQFANSQLQRFQPYSDTTSQKLDKWVLSKQSTVLKVVVWCVQHFGYLILEAFISTFLVWLRPLFEIFCDKYPTLPENMVARTLVKLSRQYVALCDRETIFALAFTGSSYTKARQLNIQLMEADQSVAASMEKILGIFLFVTKIAISLANYLIMNLVKEATGMGDTNLIWIMILNFILSFIIASFSQDFTQYIVAAQLFAYNFEQVRGCNTIVCESKELRQMRQAVITTK